MNHCQICGCEIGTPNIIKCTNPILTQGLLWKYEVCDICARAVDEFIEEQRGRNITNASVESRRKFK